MHGCGRNGPSSFSVSSLASIQVPFLSLSFLTFSLPLFLSYSHNNARFTALFITSHRLPRLPPLPPPLTASHRLPPMPLRSSALALLGVDLLPRRPPHDHHDHPPDELASYPRPPRRVTSHHSAFQTVCTASHDAPPSYAIVTHRPVISHPPDTSHTPEPLPDYTCTLLADAAMLFHRESLEPWHEPPLALTDWRRVHVIVRGTLLAIHRAKRDGPGKLLHRYTLQHAEVGLAPDVRHSVWTPQGRIAHWISPAVRARRGPHRFAPVRQHVLRVRVETEQILLAHASESAVHAMVDSLAAAIDIAHAIDERSLPRQRTVPRRRRRPRLPILPVQPAADSSTTEPVDVSPSFLTEQERILRNVYPSFLVESRPARPHTAPPRDDDEIDLAAIREQAALSLPSLLPPPDIFTPGMLHRSPASNFDPDTGKWRPPPPHSRSPSQLMHSARRCLPVLLAASPRASDVLIRHGRRVVLNWHLRRFEDWQLEPPEYDDVGHGFARVHASRPPTPLHAVREDARQGSAPVADESESATATATATATRSARGSRSTSGDGDGDDDDDDRIAAAPRDKPRSRRDKSPWRRGGVAGLAGEEGEEEGEGEVARGELVEEISGLVVLF